MPQSDGYEPSEAVSPPLPILNGVTPDPVAAGNEWRVLMESVPLHGETPRFVATKLQSVALRSPFRTGTIHLSDEGIEIEGMAMLLPPKWYPMVAILSGLPFILGQLFGGFFRTAGVPRFARLAFLLCAIPLLFTTNFLQFWLSKRRVETKMLLGWESVRGLQVDPKLRFVTLVFSSVSVPAKPVVLRLFGKRAESPPALPHNEFVTLNKLEPPIVAGFAATVEHYAPHVKRDSNVPVNPFIHWLTVVLLAILCCGVIGLLAALFIVVRSRLLSNP